MFFCSHRKNTILFGSHLTIDGYMGDPQKLNDRALVFKCLNELPGLLGMKKLGEPMVLEAPGGNPKDSGGYSGFVVIAESHISCHTFPRRRFVSIDVYTCKGEVNRKFIVGYWQKVFDLGEVEVHFIKRGRKFPIRDIV